MNERMQSNAVIVVSGTSISLHELAHVLMDAMRDKGHSPSGSTRLDQQHSRGWSCPACRDNANNSNPHLGDT